MGFESVQIRRSEFFPSPTSNPSPQEFEIEPGHPADALASMAHDQATSPTEYENERSIDVDVTSTGALPVAEFIASSAPSDLPADDTEAQAPTREDDDVEAATNAKPTLDGADAKGDEMITVWRPERRARPINRQTIRRGDKVALPPASPQALRRRRAAPAKPIEDCVPLPSEAATKTDRQRRPPLQSRRPRARERRDPPPRADRSDHRALQ